MTAGRFLRCVVVLILVGVPLGVWWWAVSPASESTWGGNGFFPVGTEPDSYIAADVQFGLWMLVFGVAAGWFVRRRWSEWSIWALTGLVLGTLGAAAVAALVGGLLGPTSTPDVLIGERVEGPLRVRAPGLLLIAPIAAVAWWFASDLAASWRDDGSDEHDDRGVEDAAASTVTAEGEAAEAAEVTGAAIPARSEPSSPA